MPLTPEDARRLWEREAVKVRVEPSTARVFAAEESQAAGIEENEDLSACPVVLGVKEIPNLRERGSAQGDRYDCARRDPSSASPRRSHPKARPLGILDDMEYATLKWVDWSNHHRLLEAGNHLPPPGFDETYHGQRSLVGDEGLKQPILQ